MDQSKSESTSYRHKTTIGEVALGQQPQNVAKASGEYVEHAMEQDVDGGSKERSKVTCQEQTGGELHVQSTYSNIKSDRESRDTMLDMA
ncbi:hypothetical protein SARC_03664 [Sphaeroforma arctica JP610]|uniref:Uncharacterized protein n=1 Tax=Sphaeroforma arctica JP610 TaxID=667725 RepID=A0A0L0G5B4_9EUKA|nr:hypothetical protein SARC_03664 [Sphaeroforma arctica JP610]KNC84099.1 hypothetical protein SARC_03664 [Sphaeroforma arctica JP610]|eukprot:XP_014158001.1 hypothetical protein SARC_03664 [Sphaeroforma arctica JP610]